MIWDLLFIPLNGDQLLWAPFGAQTEMSPPLGFKNRNEKHPSKNGHDSGLGDLPVQLEPDSRKQNPASISVATGHIRDI